MLGALVLFFWLANGVLMIKEKRAFVDRSLSGENLPAQDQKGSFINLIGWYLMEWVFLCGTAIIFEIRYVQLMLLGKRQNRRGQISSETHRESLPPLLLFIQNVEAGICGRMFLNEALALHCISVQASKPCWCAFSAAPSTPFTHTHTNTKAPCVWGNTEGAQISLYQSWGHTRSQFQPFSEGRQ